MTSAVWSWDSVRSLPFWFLVIKMLAFRLMCYYRFSSRERSLFSMVERPLS
ncbi:MAG: hypothetical protein F6J93_25190 [Oscillatoria sp. SIO1A7]|nr:hypothetical protein [Oscillatoria sp. SIO1A7]